MSFRGRGGGRGGGARGGFGRGGGGGYRQFDTGPPERVTGANSIFLKFVFCKSFFFFDYFLKQSLGLYSVPFTHIPQIPTSYC